MTSQDFSVQFDLLYNNISSNQAPGLSEYEKSVFLTQAQEALILDLYKGTAGDSFETTEEVTRYLSSLVTSEELYVSGSVPYEVDLSTVDNLWFITYQSAILENDKEVIVVPTKQETLFKDLNNPFRGPNYNRVLSTSEEDKIMLYSKYPIKSFNIKYLKRPFPIVLDDSELAINDINEFKVELPESLHMQIIQRAIQMAKTVWQL